MEGGDIIDAVVQVVTNADPVLGGISAVLSITLNGFSLWSKYIYPANSYRRMANDLLSVQSKRILAQPDVKWLVRQITDGVTISTVIKERIKYRIIMLLSANLTLAAFISVDFNSYPDMDAFFDVVLGTLQFAALLLTNYGILLMREEKQAMEKLNLYRNAFYSKVVMPTISDYLEREKKYDFNDKNLESLTEFEEALFDKFQATSHLPTQD